MENRTQTTLQFSLPADFDLEELRREYGGRLSVHSCESSPVTLWDSFEWQLWFGDHVLLSSRGFYQLARREGAWIGPEICREPCPSAVPRLACDFRLPVMKQKLGSLLGLRGLAPVGNAVMQCRWVELRDESNNTLWRLESLEFAPEPNGSREAVRVCRILPQPGSESAVPAVVRILEQNGAQPCLEGPLEMLLRGTKNYPRLYTLRPSFGLNPELPVRTALEQIVRVMLGIMRENEAWIPGDIDTEFLHDYRICLRKIRSVLGLIKGVYPKSEVGKVRDTLGKLAKETNRLRDLDVYLLERAHYTALLPPALHGALWEMFADFENERAAEVRKTVRRLRSSAHRRRMAELEAFFDAESVHGVAPNADGPIGALVFGRIYKRFRKIRACSGALQKDTPDELFHEVRVECKKLRYLLEVFAELSPGKELASAGKQLRRLQGYLGEFNDCSVQQKFLLAYWRETSVQSPKRSEVGLCVGALVALLYRRQGKQRGGIQKALARFGGRETSANFKQAFKGSLLAEASSVLDP